MDPSMFYRPAAKWQISAAFCAAILVHVGVVGLADRSAAAAADVTEVLPDVVIVPIIDDPQPVDQVDPPPDLALPPPPTTEDAFIEDHPPTRPVRQRFDRPAPQRAVVAAAAPARLQMASAKVLATHAPRPEYPYEARRLRAIGSGVALLTVDPMTGRVTDVRMLRSIGNVVLDNATISGFLRWRFKPGTVSQVQTPITYTLTGASY